MIFAVAVLALSAAQSVQAGPLYWTGRQEKRADFSILITNTTSSVSGLDDGASTTPGTAPDATPRPIFETLTGTTIEIPESLIPGSDGGAGRTPSSTVAVPTSIAVIPDDGFISTISPSETPILTSIAPSTPALDTPPLSSITRTPGTTAASEDVTPTRIATDPSPIPTAITPSSVGVSTPGSLVPSSLPVTPSNGVEPAPVPSSLPLTPSSGPASSPLSSALVAPTSADVTVTTAITPTEPSTETETETPTEPSTEPAPEVPGPSEPSSSAQPAAPTDPVTPTVPTPDGPLTTLTPIGPGPSSPSPSADQPVPTTAVEPVSSPPIQPTGTPNADVPTVSQGIPTGTSTVPQAVYASNLAQARQLNDVFAELTAESACSSNQGACVDGQVAQCNDAGSFDLSPCEGEAERCFALPLSNFVGVAVRCASVAEAEDILGTTVGGDEPASAPPAQPTSTTSEEPVPVVTLTTIVTLTGTPPGPTSTEESSQVESTTDVPLVVSTTEVPLVASTTELPLVASTTELPLVASTTDAPFATSVNLLPFEPSPTTFTRSLRRPGSSAPGPSDQDSPPQPPTARPPNPTSVEVIPVDDQPTPLAEAPQGGDSDDDAAASTIIRTVRGTPTVSLFFTSTVTQTQVELQTVTLLLRA